MPGGGQTGAGAWQGLARQGGSTKELSVRVHFVRFEPGLPDFKIPTPHFGFASLNLVVPSTSYWVLSTQCSLRSHYPCRLRRQDQVPSTAY